MKANKNSISDSLDNEKEVLNKKKLCCLSKKKNLKQKDFSKAHTLYLKQISKEKKIIKISQIVILIILLGLWELTTQIGLLDAFYFSSPSRICVELGALFSSGEIFLHMWVTLYETLIGFAIATILGVFIAIILWWSERTRKILEPYIVVLNSLPKIALGPILIIWVGSGTSSIIAMCVLICIVITIISMLNSFLQCDNDKILLMKSMGATKTQILLKLILPYSIPDFISVLKITIGMSWIGSIMGEYLTSSEGLGYLIVYGGQIFELDLVMTSILLLCVLACGMYYIVAKLEARFRR